ncbi:TRAP transporter small permease subunit [Geoalkalibacter sp.]|uniref:TRAP transporter small permease subunit n=1 Tax=Geoalkalibacter sp. TaxID=3041440 RepID=UPI00272E69A4|nr:TRAP transporter small permease subunit [Geoalkalibacter sp.]
MQLIARSIDGLNDYVGRYTSFLILPLILVVTYEVLMRYVLNAPTSWAFEMTTFIYGVHFMLALGYTHKLDGHVTIDVFEARLPKKPRTLLRILANLVIFIPAMGFLAYGSVIYAWTSWGYRELSWSSWQPKIYPYKALMALGFVLFFLQGLSKLIQDLRSLRDTE